MDSWPRAERLRRLAAFREWNEAARDHALAEARRLAEMSDEDFDEAAETARANERLERNYRTLRRWAVKLGVRRRRAPVVRPVVRPRTRQPRARHGARRASGIRSGQDPGEGGEPEPPALQWRGRRWTLPDAVAVLRAEAGR